MRTQPVTSARVHESPISHRLFASVIRKKNKTPLDIRGGIWHNGKDGVEGGGKEMKKRKKMSRAEVRQYGLF